jgi:nucleotide-binding universal stress UspA family protein
MTLVVGFGPDKGDRSPIDHAGTLARSAGQDLLVVSVVPAPWPTTTAEGTDRDFAAYSRELGARAVKQAEQALGEACPDVDARAMAEPARSVPAGLVASAERAEAAMIVVGSGTDGPYGHVVLSTTADRLLYSSTVPVSVATRGYRAASGARVGRVTCAVRGDAGSRAVLERTAAISAEIGAALRVVTFGVRGRTMYPPEVLGEDLVLASFVEQATAALDAAVTETPGVDPAAQRQVAVGRSWSEALEALDWELDEVLVVGSSSSARLMERVFLGSHARKIVRHSPVPVVVVP